MAGPKLRAFRSRLIFRALVVVSAIGRRIPLRVGRAFGALLGSLANRVVRREREKALRHIAIAFPEWSDAQRGRAVRAMFRHHGRSLFEIAYLPNVNATNVHETTIIEGLERVLGYMDAGRGVVTFTAHCGNWEWLSYVTGLAGRPVSVLQRERDEPEMNRYITELRARAGVRTIDRGSDSSAREMIATLRRGGMLAFVIDQNIKVENVKVPFFGRDALTPIGPAKLAVRTEAVAVTALIERRSDGMQYAKFLEPIECRRDDDPVALTALITRQIEEQIRKVPEQWVWFHDRWRDRK